MKLERAIIISLLAHVAIVALLAFNFQFSKVDLSQNKQSSPTKQINATSVNSKNVEKLVKKLKQKDIDKKNKEIERLRKLKSEEERSRKRRIEEENKAAEAKKKQADSERKRKLEEKKAADAKKKRIADDKARKKKIAEDKRKKEEADKKAKAEAERKRKKKEADDKKKREEAARKKKEAEEKAAQEALEREMDQQMADEAAALAEANHQQVLTEVDKYNLLIRNKIKRNWIAPEQKGSCIFRIGIAPGGLITGITVLSGDSQHCDSGRRAINKSEPLPVSSDPDVFAVLKVRTFELENKSDNDVYDN